MIRIDTAAARVEAFGAEIPLASVAESISAALEQEWWQFSAGIDAGAFVYEAAVVPLTDDENAALADAFEHFPAILTAIKTHYLDRVANVQASVISLGLVHEGIRFPNDAATHALLTALRDTNATEAQYLIGGAVHALDGEVAGTVLGMFAVQLLAVNGSAAEVWSVIEGATSSSTVVEAFDMWASAVRPT